VQRGAAGRRPTAQGGDGVGADLRRRLRRLARRRGGHPPGRRPLLDRQERLRMALQVVRDPRTMRIVSEELRRDGRRIALVPTMGYLHAGHVALLEAGRRRSDALVLSIFVNPIQFGPNEDLARYPRDLEGDLAKARAAGVDWAFMPDDHSMYPSPPLTRVH